MASNTANTDGQVTPNTLLHYSNLAEAQPSLIIVEYSFIHISGRSETNQLGIHDNANIEGLKLLAQTIKKSGALVGIQITHAGGKTNRSLTHGPLMSPSGIRVPVKDQIMEQPDSMDDNEILLWKIAFAEAVDRAVQSGFDLVEFHSAHGYGLNQWLSGITNQREDYYGQNTEGRMTLLLEIVQAARKNHPNLLLSVRIPGQDFIEGGLSIDDSILIARYLENAGIDLIHVSSGIGGWRRPDSRNGEGYLVNEAELIQAAIQVPVIGVGGITTGAYIDESLKKRRFNLAAVGRAISKNPKEWRELNLKL
jgi:NADPH2 dehydrogenase